MLFGERTSQDDTVVAMLAAAIRRDISFGQLNPDQKLKIGALRQRYGGSNHSMRETLRVLTAEGMVEATSQRGFRVTSASEEDMRDILMMRVTLEQLGLEKSIAAATVAWEGRVVAAFHAMRRAEEQVRATPDDLTALQWDEACRAASEALVSGCGSARLIDSQQKFYNQSRRFRLALLREGRLDFARRAERIEALQSAVVEHRADQALGLLETHIGAEMAGETPA